MTDKRKPEGIWGWLLLPVIGLIIGAIISIIVSFLSLFGYFFGEEWAYLTFLLLLVGAFFSIYSLF